MGLDIDPAQVITSATALIEHIAAHRQGSRFMIVGGPTLAGAVEEAGGVTTENPAETEIVVTSLDTSFNYEKLKSAHLALQNKALYWATNLDASVPVENGFRPGAGSIAAALSTAAGRGPSVVFGKPHPFMADIALQRLGLNKGDCLVVGDRMDTDILFAKNAGISSVLTLTGATRKDDLTKYSFQPDYVVEDMSGLIEIVG
jgi:HAD superfamily hydrolase (TIGR01450 family)